MLTGVICSDLHRTNMPGDPASDDTQEWQSVWDNIPGDLLPDPTGHELETVYYLGAVDHQLKICAGDMTEGLQCRSIRVTHTDVEGNHDRGTCRGRRELIIATPRHRTYITHGDLLDPLWIKVIGPPVTRAIGCLERRIDKDIDIKLDAWARRVFHVGRHGDIRRYATGVARRAKELKCDQAVFGHLHQFFDISPNGLLRLWNGGALPEVFHRPDLAFGINIICTGCCCNGRTDIRYVGL